MDFVFDAFTAWNSLGLFLMAFVFCLIGGGITLYELIWRIRGQRTKARIKEVRMVGKHKKSSSNLENHKEKQADKKGASRFAHETYYSVYEYQLPNGERMEHVSSWGSNIMGKNLPGRGVTLLISPHDPEKVKRPSTLLLVFGLLFLLPGLFILQQAINTFEFNIMTVLIPFVIFGYIILRITRFISKIPQKEFKEGIKELREKGFSVTSSSGQKGENARVLSTSEVQERMKAYVKNYKIGGYVCLLIAVGLMAGAYYTGADLSEKLAVGVSARGEVVGFESRYSSSSEGSGYTYYSIIKYPDMNGRVVKFTDNFGSSHRMHKRGDEVDVLYNPNDPEDAMIDRGIWNWLISGALAVGAFLLLFFGMSNLKIARLYSGASYRSRI